MFVEKIKKMWTARKPIEISRLLMQTFLFLMSGINPKRLVH